MNDENSTAARCEGSPGRIRFSLATLLIVMLVLVVGTLGFSAERDNEQEASEDAPPKPDSQIAKWISQLDDEKFNVREQATRGLIKSGLKALPTVLKATQSKQAEVRNRAFAILFALSKSDDKPTAKAVLTAAEEMLLSQDRRRVAQAKKILKNIGERKIQGKWIIVEYHRKGKKRWALPIRFRARR